MFKNQTLNYIIGFALIFLITYFWSKTVSREKVTQAQEKARIDSLDAVKTGKEEKTKDLSPGAAPDAAPSPQPVLSGNPNFLVPSQPQVEPVLENSLMKVTFQTKGGRIKEVELKNYQKKITQKGGPDLSVPVRLLENPKNRFGLTFSLASGGSDVNTDDLDFQLIKSTDAEVVFRAYTTDSAYIEQQFSLTPDNYSLKYASSWKGIQLQGGKPVRFQWMNYMDRIEQNVNYEKYYSTAYFKELDENPDYCNCRKDDDVKDLPAVKWVSHAQQFFNTSLIAKDRFLRAEVSTRMMPDSLPEMKLAASSFELPENASSLDMEIYSGPNEFKRLHAYKMDLEDVISFGSSILGTINRWVVRPIFNFLSWLIGSQGIAILLLTLIVKLLLYPLTYRMIYSQSKMAALKPQITALKDKYGDDQQQVQVETMKLYREFGVNPLGGCLPMLLQMPIWLALYRFFPAAIEFRQVSFLWANDLSSYDVIANLPMGYHISLFALLWTISSLIYAWYTAKDMDIANVNPAMKYMQYFMPLIFFFFFNSFASGLTCYLMFSNFLNIGQTVGTKNYLIDHEKIRKKMEEFRQKPKKKTGFQARLEQALKEQQRIQQERSKKK